MKLDTSADLDALTLPNPDNGVSAQFEASLEGMKDRPDWMLRSLFQLLERHPEHDFGAPGGIVHFLEDYPRRDYQAEMLASLKRRPTTHTTWMLNRLINGTTGPTKLSLLETMNQLCKATQPEVRERARSFMAYQAKSVAT